MRSIGYRKQLRWQHRQRYRRRWSSRGYRSGNRCYRKGMQCRKQSIQGRPPSGACYRHRDAGNHVSIVRSVMVRNLCFVADRVDCIATIDCWQIEGRRLTAHSGRDSSCAEAVMARAPARTNEYFILRLVLVDRVYVRCRFSWLMKRLRDVRVQSRKLCAM